MMKFFRIVREDIVRSMYVSLPCMVVLETFYILVSVSFFSEMMNWMDLSEATLGDQLVYIFSGMKEYIPSPNVGFHFPALWVLLYALILFSSLRYMTEDLLGFGQKNMVCLKSRIIWWLSKCVGNICTSLFSFSLCFITTIVSVLICRSRMELTVSAQILMIVDVGDCLIQPEQWKIMVEVCFMPILVGATLCILQMMLSLVLNTVLSYILMIILLIGSAYYQSPYMIGNYAMVIRSRQIIANGVEPITGALFCCGLIALSVVAGIMIIRKKNILGEEIHTS